MKIIMYVLAVAVAVMALFSLYRGIQFYLADGSFQVASFGIAVVGIFLAGLWFKRARAM